MKKLYPVFPALVSVALGLAGCARSNMEASSSSSPYELYSQLTEGMTRAEVELIVGPPTFNEFEEKEGPSTFWYLPAPQLEPHESPWGFCGIKVVYSEDRVLEKQLNHQGSR